MVSSFFKMGLIGFGAAVALTQSIDIPQARAFEALDAEESPQADAAERLAEALKSDLMRKYPGARIELNPDIHWTSGSLPEDFQGLSIRGETPRGELLFAVSSSSVRRESSGWVGFSAWIPARIALRRIHPGDKLTADMFNIQDVNVASGQVREYRGVILAPETSVSNLEARQTVLEGKYLLSTAVQRVPDVRRGDAVRVYLVSNGLSVATPGIAEEPAFIDGQVRVMASKSKRELQGRLLAGGIVEVKL